MKIFSLLMILALLPLLAEPLSQEDRDFAMSNLHATRKMFLDAIAGLSPEQWKFKPAPDRWSIAECAEHVALNEDGLFEYAKQLLSKPQLESSPADPKTRNDEVLKLSTDRSRTFKAQEELQPSGQWATPEALSTYFKQKRDRTIKYIETTADELRLHGTEGSNGTTAYDFILVLAGHTERHVAQINEVKADPKYPR